MRLTIIIPMYKVEEFIFDCLHSILDQDDCGIDYDIVAVNDGSPDRSAAIAEIILGASGRKYTIINQENSGLSCARNAGLAKAEGDFIWFIDSDDTIAENSFKTLSEIDCTGIDAIAVNAVNITGGEEKPRLDFKDFDGKVNNCRELFRSGRWSECAPFTIYRKDFLEKHRLTFIPHLFHEDNEFSMRSYHMMDKVYATNAALYRVRINPDSITRAGNIKRHFDLIEIAEAIADYKRRCVNEPADRQIFSKRVAICLNSALEDNRYFDAATISKLKDELYAHRTLFKEMMQSSSLKHKIEGALMTMFSRHIVQVYAVLNIFQRR